MCLRTGSKAEITIAPGVSSTMISTPAARSRARMLRPSRPMILPLISSLGIWTVVVVTSETVGVETRWMMVASICLARRSSSSRPVVSNLRILCISVASLSFSSRVWSSVMALSFVRPATRSSSFSILARASSSSTFTALIFSTRASTSFSRSSTSVVLRSKRPSRFSNRSCRRFCSCSRFFSSFLASSRILTASVLASTRISLDSTLASSINFCVRSSSELTRCLATSWRIKYPRPAPTAIRSTAPTDSVSDIDSIYK